MVSCVIHLHITPMATKASLLPFCKCGTIYRLTYDRTAATNNRESTDHSISWLLIGALKILLLTYLLMCCTVDQSLTE